MKQLLPILLSLLLWIITTGCTDLDRYSRNPAHTLTFSQDTVSFDTVFTTVGSSTAHLLVYNRNPEPLNIASITMEGGNGQFFLNVDGLQGTSFENVYLRARDSLYLFIETTLKPTEKNQPQRIECRLLFRLHTQPQQVLLQAWAQDATQWRRKTIDRDTTLTGEKPFLIYDTLVVSPDATLTLQPGTTLCFHHKAALVIDGCMNSQGTVAQPVILRGDRTDRQFSDLPYDLVPGQWGGVRISRHSRDNHWSHTHIRNTTHGVCLDSTDTDRRTLRMESCRITNSSGTLFSSFNGWVEAVNCEITNAASNVCLFTGGRVRFTHCTLANYPRFAAPNAPTLTLQNYQPDRSGPKPVALLEASFNNCIIDGKGSTEVALHDASVDLNRPTPFEHRFDHCLIKANGEDDANFIKTVWGVNADFLNTAKEGYAFDFRLDSLSKARSVGADRYGVDVPFDFYGLPRPATSPDLGAYQWVPAP